MSQVQYTPCLCSDVFTLGEKQAALAKILFDRKLIESDDYLDLTLFAPPAHEVVELEFAVIGQDQPDALVFLRRAVENSKDRARAIKQGGFAS